MSKCFVSRSRLFGSAALLASLAGTLVSSASAQMGDTGVAMADVSAWFTEPVAPTGSVEDRLTEATRLLSAGQVVRAQRVITGLTEQSVAAGLSNRERQRAFQLWEQIGQRLTVLDPQDLSLQRAELSMAEGNLIMAERHAEGVRDAAAATPMQRMGAVNLLDQIASRRIELELLVPGAMARTEEAFEAGRLSEAKALIHAVQFSGVSLTGDQQTALATYKSRIMAHEAGQGTVLAGAMAQPGVVQRNTGVSNFDTQPTADPLDEARRVAAQSLRAEADGYYQSGQYAEASRAYNRLLSEFRQYLAPEEIGMIEGRANESRAIQTGQPIDELTGERRIENQRISAEFANLLEQADTALAEGDTDGAGRLSGRALSLIENNESYFAQSEVDRLKAEAQAMQQRVDARRRQQETANAATEAARLRQEALDREQRAAAERESQKRELLRRVRALQMEQDYDGALQVIDQILFLDPNDVAALFMRDILIDTRYYVEFNRLRQAAIYTYADQTRDNMDALLAPASIVTFPADWPQLSFRRGEPTAYADSPENRRVLAQLETTRIPANFNSNPIENVIAFLEGVTQIDMDADWDALEQIGVERGDPVSLNLTSVPVSTVLDRVLAKLSAGDFGDAASWAIQDGVVVISSDEQLRKQRELVIYDIRDLLIEVPDYDNAPDFDLQSVLQNGGGGGGGGGGQSPFQENDDNDPERIPLDERIRRITDIITQNVDFEGWRDNGGDTGYIQELNGNLIITNTARNHREIAGLLARLREIRAMQINVESRFLLVNQEFFEQIGFDLDIYFNATSNQVTAARGTNPNTLPSDFFDFERGGYVRTTTPPLGTEVANVPPAEFSPISSAQNSLGLASALAGGSFASSILSSAPALGIAGQFLDDIQVDFLVTATQADRRSVSLNAPRLTFTNGQRSNIYVATQVSFVSDLQPIVSNSAVGFDPQINVISEGVVLDVEGTVTGGRRYVTLNITTSVSQLARPFRTQSVTAVAGGQLVNSADTQSFIELPEATVTSVSTTVTVPDQGTILIGGQRLVSEFDVETGVPVLSKIPILNRFFSNRIESKEEQTLLILIKPTVLIQNEQEESAYPGIGEQIRTNFGG
ncbi:MAG: hypothetical protein R3B68_07765 [Phycisphaerales bacterium]